MRGARTPLVVIDGTMAGRVYLEKVLNPIVHLLRGAVRANLVL